MEYFCLPAKEKNKVTPSRLASPIVEIEDMQKEDQFAQWAAKLENLESGVLDDLQEQFEREDVTVWEPLPADSSQEVLEVKVKEGGEEVDEEGYQWGELKFLCGAVFQGRFSKDLKNRQGKLYKDERSVKQSFIDISIGR